MLTSKCKQTHTPTDNQTDTTENISIFTLPSLRRSPTMCVAASIRRQPCADKIDQIFCQHLFLSGCCSQNRLIIQFSVLFNSGLTYCNNVGLDQCSYSTLGPVSTWMGDHLWMGKPPWCITRHPGLLSLSLPSMGRRNRVPGKCWGSKQAHCAMN